jgi:Short C-terminal domain
MSISQPNSRIMESSSPVMSIALNEPVCPDCGTPPHGASACKECGRSLAYTRLPTRSAWAAKRTAADRHATGTQPAAVEIPCPKCKARKELSADAVELRCRGCSAHYRFLRCSSCGSTAQVGATLGRGAPWSCPSCGTKSTLPMFGQPPFGSAAEIYRQLSTKGLLSDDPDKRTLGGFTMIGGNGYDIPVKAVCSVNCTPTDVRIVIAGQHDALAIPYDALTAVELSGGTRTSGARFRGGGFGVTGAIEGMAIASVLNALSRKTTINTVLRVATSQGELFLHHGSVTPAIMRNTLSPLFTRFEASRAAPVAPAPAPADDPTTQLERLTRLRDAGALTEDEFQAARTPLVNRLLESA